MPHPPLVIANVVQVRLLCTVANEGAYNVLHASHAGSVVVNQALANTVGAAIKAAWTANIAPLCTSANLARVGLRSLSTANAPEFLDTGSIATASGTGDALPGQNAICVTLRTAMSGKSFRGRIYVGGFSEGQNDATGNTLAAAGTAAVAYVTAIQNALTSSALTLCVASRPAYAFTDVRTWQLSGGQTQVDTIGRGNARTGGSQPVTLIQSRTNKWESQRRRGNGRGGSPSIFSVVAQQEIEPFNDVEL